MAKTIFERVKNALRAFREKTQTEEAEVLARGRVISEHPSYKITPAKLKSLLDAAELGDITSQHELFMDIEERDSDIGSNIATRKRSILTLDWGIVAPENASAEEEKWVEEIVALFDRIGYLDDFLVDCMDAVGHGFSAMEIEWHLVNGRQLPMGFLHRPQSWFRLAEDDRLLLKTPESPMGEPLRPFGWVVHKHKSRSVQLARAGLYRTLVWLYMFKHYSVHDFAEFLELYGMPIRIGKYGAGATESEKKTLLRALAQIGHNAAGIMPESMQVELHNAAQGSSSNNPFLQMIDWCEKSIARIILGQTLTSGADGKSSTNALGQIHNEVRRDLLVSDARQLAQTITQQVILVYLQINVDPNVDASRIPRFEFDTKETADLASFAEALPKLVEAGVQIPEVWVHEKLGIPEPKGDELILKPFLNDVETGFKDDQTEENATALSAKVKVIGHSEGCGCAACSGVALKAEQAGDNQALLDHCLDEALKQVDFNAQLDPLVQKAVAVLMACESFEQASEALATIYPDLDSEQHHQYLSRALFISELLGGSTGGANG